MDSVVNIEREFSRGKKLRFEKEARQEEAHKTQDERRLEGDE
jgi:hypothetical protein